MIEIYLFIFGLFIGSFLNVLIERLSKEESIGGRSHCDFCKHTLAPADLVPVFSYLFLRGKCRYCRKKLSPQYPLVEILTGIIFVLSWTYSPFVTIPLLILTIALSCVLEVIVIADLKYQIIPDEMQIVLVVIGLAMFTLQGVAPSAVLVRIAEGALIMTPILFLYLITKGKGMGFGDVKLAFGIGILLGTYKGALALYIAFLTGAVVGVCLLATTKSKMKSKIAFGPFLVVGIVALFFFEKQVFFVVDKILLNR